jgi:O-methyltransferase
MRVRGSFGCGSIGRCNEMTNELIGRALRRIRGRPADGAENSPPPASELDARNRPIVERALPYTMTSVLRLNALVEAVRYCEQRGVPGAFAECGVWRGGSVLAMILTLQELGVDDRDIHLYDTFEGMTQPTEHDRSATEGDALEAWEQAAQEGERAWPEMFGEDVFDENSVRDTLVATGYPESRIHIVKGPVGNTIPAAAPARLALLRLDTDWYESTRHELDHLYPRLATGGVLIIDDYGHWEGARRAVDEYFDEHARPLLLNRIDYTGRIAVKH